LIEDEYILDENVKNDSIIYIKDLKDLVDKELIELVNEVPFDNIRPYFEYALLSPGKRLRPILTILSSQIVGGSLDQVISLALAFEVLHTTTLVHDDVIDNDKLRRERLTLHEKWSKNDAILVGDALFSTAVGLIAKYDREIIETASIYGIQLCSGELMDLVLSSSYFSEEEYFKKIRSKSAALFKACTRCGSMVSTKDKSTIEALADYGEYLGIAYQIKDDLEDILNKDNFLLDMKKGRLALPFIHLYQKGNEELRKIVDLYFGKPNLPSNIADILIKELNNTGALQYCKNKIKQNIDNAIKSLKSFKDSIYKDCLLTIADFIRK
jgi:geranylgeranyl pyrophosphate synthase